MSENTYRMSDTDKKVMEKELLNTDNHEKDLSLFTILFTVIALGILGSLFGFLFLIISILPLGYVIFARAKVKLLEAQGLTIEGVVVEKTDSNKNNEKYIFAYKVEGKTYYNNASPYIGANVNDKDYKMGDKVTLFVEPKVLTNITVNEKRDMQKDLYILSSIPVIIIVVKVLF